jgi:hypothetical protein
MFRSSANANEQKRDRILRDLASTSGVYHPEGVHLVRQSVTQITKYTTPMSLQKMDLQFRAVFLPADPDSASRMLP